ncbi:hypothetical protein [Pseudomonas sp.]|uniref:hypothetical protein n=1 Tax=Pseudomonas sp. TaxID=306 RepID=UPI002906EB4C|nr:hypothetical protein [Pseudomonas sp.]MDU4254586.1 hypothetical protein [Pseudomonas sp.]
MTTKLTPAQVAALEQLRAAGGRLDYRADVFGFCAPDAPRTSRVVMGTAKALIAAGLVRVSRFKQLRDHEVPDQLELAEHGH